MKISVIIPTYKPQAYLWECLDSLVTQTFPKENFEVILVLNGCTEPWKSQIEEYISQRMQGMTIVFIHTERGGVSNARNIALDAANGEYVTFIDDDDLVSPKYLEELYHQVSPDTISLCYAYAFNDGNKETQLPYAITDTYNLFSRYKCMKFSFKVRKYFSGPCMKLIPMSFIQERRYDVRFKNGEDSLFMFLISDKFKTVAFTGKDAVYYRRFRDNSATTKQKRYSYIIRYRLLLIREYSKIYFSKVHDYSLGFYLTRVIASLKSLFK